MQDDLFVIGEDVLGVSHASSLNTGSHHNPDSSVALRKPVW